MEMFAELGDADAGCMKAFEREWLNWFWETVAETRRLC